MGFRNPDVRVLIVALAVGAVIALLMCPAATFGATYSLDDTATVVVLHPDSLGALESVISSSVASAVASSVAGVQVTATVDAYRGGALLVDVGDDVLDVLLGLFLGMVFVVFVAGLAVVKLVAP